MERNCGISICLPVNDAAHGGQSYLKFIRLAYTLLEQDSETERQFIYT